MNNHCKYAIQQNIGPLHFISMPDYLNEFNPEYNEVFFSTKEEIKDLK